MAAGGTLFIVVALAILELSKVTVSKSTPSHIAQFGTLFQEILDTKKDHRFVIFIDELDRCSPDDVMATLEGLRTFLGHPRCVFVVAFDREAVAGIIARRLGEAAPRENAAPYYRTSGEYLDKIFQFQLALPPQPVHTFRRFASSLVRERGGVWGQLRDHRPDLLDRVVNILSPMHLASPRRTKVLLNDFAVNARVYEGMKFEWLDRAEEIAVLTVLQTEFPRLAADLEREPALMRFLYREEVPTRASLVALVEQYAGKSESNSAPLDEVVGGDPHREVKGQLEENLARYLRLLRERNVPEPRADLIMMHSDGSLLAFKDPNVYHELLSAADMPRQDVLHALKEASESDLAEGIRYLLDQTEKEAKDVSDRLVILAGEIVAQMPSVDPDLARLLGGRMTSSVSDATLISLEGYGVAAAVAYTETEMQTILGVASTRAGAGVVQVIARANAIISDDNWIAARRDMLPLIVTHAIVAPEEASAFFVKLSQDVEAELSWDQISALVDALTATAPEPVEPVSATAAARAAAAEQDAENDGAYEEKRKAYRGIAAELTSGWTEMALGSELRQDLLRILRQTEDGGGFLDLHDALISRDIDRGQRGEANLHLLGAIADSPFHAHHRWSDKLTDSETVGATTKERALQAVLKMIAKSSHETVRESGARVAQKIAGLPSERFDLSKTIDLIRADLVTEWDEHSDSRFETQLRMLSVLDTLEAPSSDTDDARAALYVSASHSAQTDAATPDVIVASLEREDAEFAGRVAQELSELQLWNEEHAEVSLRIVLAGQRLALSKGLAITHLPLKAISQVGEGKVARLLAASWLATAPPVSELKQIPNAASLNSDAWRQFGMHANEAQRDEAWGFLVWKGASTENLRALSSFGQSLRVYEEASAAAREAKTVTSRERAVRVFLALPVRRGAADEARALVKVMAQDRKRTELALGVMLLRAYADSFSANTMKSLRPLVSRWAEEGEGLIAKRDISWLVSRGFATKSSPLMDIVKRMTKR
jgi:hypothetical protein